MTNGFSTSSIEFLFRSREIAGRFFGPALPWLEFLAFVLSIAFIVGAIYCIIRSNWLVYRVDEWVDVLNAGDLSRRRILRGWRQILERIESPKPTDWKLAILEADKILGDVLRLAGFTGHAVHERLERVPETVLANVAELKNAHRLRDRVAHEPDFECTQEQAVSVIEAYRKAFRELELID